MDLFKGPTLFLPIRLCAIIGVLFVVVLGYYNWQVAVLAVVLLGIIYLYSLNQKQQQQSALEDYLMDLKPVMADSFRIALNAQQILIADRGGKLHWWNKIIESWQEELADSEQNLSTLLPGFEITDFWPQGGTYQFSKNEKSYCADIRLVGLSEGKESFLAFYIQDITEVEEERQRLQDNQPVVAQIQIDNYVEVLQGMVEEEKNDILLEANRKLSAWVSKYHGVLRRVSEDSYTAFFTAENLQALKDEKVSILDDMRELEGENKLPVTLSLGIASGESSLNLLNERSQSALDLALGRGGDQAVLVCQESTQFFGGKSKAVEKFTRVKARVVSQALRELIRESDRVLIMGHKQEDFDSLGAALGMARMSFALGTPASVLLSSKSPDVNQLRKQLKLPKEGMQDYFIDSDDARNLLTERTLLIIVDTHRPESVAAPEILELAERVVVIDHHRRTENIIVNPHLLYLEPSSSSTSELVSELMTYLEERVKLTPMEACILYAGIVLDTKNFIIQTGSRTLEAASFLRRNGADPQAIQRLFWMDIEGMKAKAELIREMRIFEEAYAITHCSETEKDATVIAAQAADMMSSLLGVRASFVLYPIDADTVGISARSQGDVNVQLIMEALGGGGHQMAAATQLGELTMEEAEEQLKEAIKAYEKDQ